MSHPLRVGRPNGPAPLDADAEAALPIWSSPFPYSKAVAGNAARKILLGEIDPGDLEGIIARCHWCNTVVGYCYSGRPECWHLAARMLLDQGLRPLVSSSGLTNETTDRGM
jgi:hypothetical protein